MKRIIFALALLASVAACNANSPSPAVILSDAAKAACAGQAAANAATDILTQTHNTADAASAAMASALLGKACVWGTAAAPVIGAT